MSEEHTLYEVFKIFEMFEGCDTYQLQILKSYLTPDPSYRARCYRLVPDSEEGYADWLMIGSFPRVSGDTEADALLNALRIFGEFVRQ